MDRITITRVGELNDFLPTHRRHRTLDHPWPGRASIKDRLESIGVPHPEIGLLLKDRTPVDFGYLVQPNDTIHAYGLVDARELAFPPLLPPPEPRFVLNVHLGRLAEHLRLLGFDTLYRNDYDDPELAQTAGNERRILLTRDLGLLNRISVVHG
jgi:uncharacterized protein